jgi:hypothetical protein
MTRTTRSAGRRKARPVAASVPMVGPVCESGDFAVNRDGGTRGWRIARCHVCRRYGVVSRHLRHCAGAEVLVAVRMGDDTPALEVNH